MNHRVHDDVEPSADAAHTAAPAPTGPVHRLVRLAFVITLVVFVVGGFVFVGAQAVQLVLGDGAGVEAVSERVGPPTFVVATVCGLLAFVQEYLAPHRGGEQG